MFDYGLLLREADAPDLIRRGARCLLLPPGFAMCAADVQKRYGVEAFSLNMLIENGEMAGLSRRIAPFLRALMADLEAAPVEAVSSQNDLYQYHLRYQFLFLTALERFFIDRSAYRLLLAAVPYRRYESPMRPELGMLYVNEQLLATLAARLIERLGGVAMAPPSALFGAARDAVKLALRKRALQTFMLGKLIQKTWHARRRAVMPQVSVPGAIGMIVRTDSEVIAASFLIERLRTQGQHFVVFHDEMLSSATTLARLAAYGIDSVSIGAAQGLPGVLRALVKAPRRLAFAGKIVFAPGVGAAEQVLFGDPRVQAEMRARLLDFSVAQHHFTGELTLLARPYRLACLVTFAYVDQWGAVIRAAGAALGIPTVAVQNAAQDPEEYPRLCWADHYCVESRYLKARLVDMGYPAALLSATGLPQFSAAAGTPPSSAASVAARRRLLLLTQPIYAEHYERLIAASARLCADHQIELAIKFHPRQANSDYQGAIEAARAIGPVALFQAEPLDSLVQSASIVVSVVSAALIRAVNLGTPCVSFLPLEERHLDLYYAHESTVFCTPDMAAYQALIDTALADFAPFFDEAMRKRDHYLDVHATFEPSVDSTANIVDVIVAQADTGLPARRRAA